MDLQELLDLLADSPPGNISAADMRTIVTELWNKIEAAAAAQIAEAIATAIQTAGTNPAIIGSEITLDGPGPAKVYQITAWTPSP